MLRNACFAITTWAMMACHAVAAPVDDLVRTLDLPRLFGVLSDEGRVYGRELKDQLGFSDTGGTWERIVAGLHDPQRLEREAANLLRRELAGKEAEIAAMTEFFGSETGKKIIQLEIAARVALMDDSLREAAGNAWLRLQEDHSPRVGHIEQMIETNDLLEQNVAGALNSNLAFYRGMVEGYGEEAPMDPGTMMSDLWSQEPQIRQETGDWLSGYMTLAYGPLTNAEIESYIAFSQSPEGQLLNRALFTAFGAMFDHIAYNLGLAATRLAVGEDI